MMESADSSRSLVNGLKRIEGQIRGLQRMLEAGEDCSDVITQISAVRNALDRVGFVILTNRIEECISRKVENGECNEKSLEEALKLFIRLS